MSLKTYGIVGTAIIAATATTAALVPGASAVGAAPEQRSSTAAVQALAPAAAKGTLDSKVRGEFGRNGTVRGSFDPKRFIVKRGKTFAVGTLNAKLRRGSGALVGSARREITIPVRNASTGPGKAVQAPSCRILNLKLGPLRLNLLGLRVDLNRVLLKIKAIPGAGNLLGNLLCAVAGLLDGGLPQQLRLANILNRILSLLRA